MKKTTALLLTFLLLAAFTQSAFAIADSAQSACLINEVTGEVVFAKNENEKRPMASTTKIMTALLAIENSSPDDIVTVSREAYLQEGSAAYVEENMQITMRDLLYGLMLNSGNDAAVAISEHITGGTDAFAEMMNERALSLGAFDTHFVNANGLPADDHYTTASDLALITYCAMKNPLFREIVSASYYSARPLNSEKPLEFFNHNKLLGTYDGATGVKTGYTQAAGRCLVSSATRDNMEFIAVTLDDPNDWQEHAEMLDYAFAHHSPQKIIEKGSVYKVAQIGKKSYNMVAAEDFIVPVRENSGAKTEVVTHTAVNVRPPLNKGEKVGYLEVRSALGTVGTVDLVSESDIWQSGFIVMKDSLFSSFLRIIKKVLI